ncbi:MAG: hypothetical protein E7036_08405 [Opitutales bacterium]|nr:hypothetical protein [Opitutales bacterium]
MEISAENISLFDSIFKSDGQFWFSLIFAVISMIVAFVFAYRLYETYDNYDVVDSYISENSKFDNRTRDKYLIGYRIRMSGISLIFGIVAVVLYFISFSNI